MQYLISSPVSKYQVYNVQAVIIIVTHAKNQMKVIILNIMLVLLSVNLKFIKGDLFIISYVVKILNFVQKITIGEHVKALLASNAMMQSLMDQLLKIIFYTADHQANVQYVPIQEAAKKLLNFQFLLIVVLKYLIILVQINIILKLV